MSVCISGFRDATIERFVKENEGTMVNVVPQRTTHLIVKAGMSVLLKLVNYR